MRERTFYLAGPMSGVQLFNFPMFDLVRDHLLALGYNVISPADLDREVGFDPETGVVSKVFLEEAMKRDLDAIMKADAIVMLPGWERSTGAKAELALARWRHIDLCAWNDEHQCVVPLEYHGVVPTEPVQTTAEPRKVFPGDDSERHKYPVAQYLMLFREAFAALARHTWENQQKHVPGATTLTWDHTKSVGTGDQTLRHYMDDELEAHAWRAIEMLQRKLTKLPPYDSL